MKTVNNSPWFSSSAIPGPGTLWFPGLSFMSAKMAPSADAVTSIIFTVRAERKDGGKSWHQP